MQRSQYFAIQWMNGVEFVSIDTHSVTTDSINRKVRMTLVQTVIEHR